MIVLLVFESDTEERLQETDDEGIERDSGDPDAEDYTTSKINRSYKNSSACTVKSVLQVSLFVCVMYLYLFY